MNISSEDILANHGQRALVWAFVERHREEPSHHSQVWTCEDV